MLSEKNRKKLNKNLPKLAAKKIKEKMLADYNGDYTEAYIRMVLNGERSNDLIIRVALEIASSHQDEIEAINNAASEI